MKKTYENSLKIGMSNSYLSVYRSTRGFPKKTSPKVILEAFNEERKHQENIIAKLQEMWYWLHEYKHLYKFGGSLQSFGIYKSKICMYRASEDWFGEFRGLKKRSAIAKWERVLQEFRDYKRLHE